MRHNYHVVEDHYLEAFEAKLNNKGERGWRVTNFTVTRNPMGFPTYTALLELSADMPTFVPMPPLGTPPAAESKGELMGGLPENIRSATSCSWADCQTHHPWPVNTRTHEECEALYHPGGVRPSDCACDT